eukprot:m.69180 g.69180  ORF g.69180 m.69180 type:complete len:333 (+) comp18377_c0_seq1:258-1256(+)
MCGRARSRAPMHSQSCARHVDMLLLHIFLQITRWLTTQFGQVVAQVGDTVNAFYVWPRAQAPQFVDNARNHVDHGVPEGLHPKDMCCDLVKHGSTVTMVASEEMKPVEIPINGSTQIIYPAFYLGSNGRKPPAAFEHLDVGSTANELGPGLLAQHKGLDGAIENVLVVGYFVEKGTGNAFRRLKALCINPTTGEVLSGPYRVAGLMPYPLTADRTIAPIAQEKLRMLYVPGQSLPPRPARPTAPPVKELEQKETGLVNMMATYALSERYPSRPRNPPKWLTFPCVPLATTELSSRVHCHSHFYSAPMMSYPAAPTLLTRNHVPRRKRRRSKG